MPNKTEKCGWQNFLNLVQKARSEKQLDDFFDFFLTHEERVAVAKRILITKALLKGEKTQREISQEQGVSIAIITRGSNYLKTIDEKFKKFLIENLS